MKRKVLFTIFALMAVCRTYAYDIAVENEDGVTIYYNFINKGRELCVTNPKVAYEHPIAPYTGIVNIPQSIYYEGHERKVTAIGFQAFAYSKVTSVLIPEGVTEIGKYAFIGSSLSSVSIPNSVTEIGFEAFGECENLSTVEIGNGLTEIPPYAFYKCLLLRSISIPENVTKIGEDAFKSCILLNKAEFSSIESLFNINFITERSNPLTYSEHLYINGEEIKDFVFPNDIEEIGNYIFSGFKAPSFLTIPSSVKKIGKGVFRGCSNITSVIIPEGVRGIGEYAFYGCKNLSYVSIPNSMMTTSRVNIGSYCFDGCENLNTIVSFIDNPQTTYESAFTDKTYRNATLYVPKGTTELYEKKYPWSNFAWIEEGAPTNVDAQSYGSQNNVEYFSVDGKLLNRPRRGATIVKIGDKAIKVIMK